jgi:hypothetical protein
MVFVIAGSAEQGAQGSSPAPTDSDVEINNDGSVSVTLPPISDKSTRTVRFRNA